MSDTIHTLSWEILKINSLITATQVVAYRVANDFYLAVEQMLFRHEQGVLLQ